MTSKKSRPGLGVRDEAGRVLLHQAVQLLLRASSIQSPARPHPDLQWQPGLFCATIAAGDRFLPSKGHPRQPRRDTCAARCCFGRLYGITASTLFPSRSMTNAA